MLARRLLFSPGILKPAKSSIYRQESIRVMQVAVLARCKNALVSHLDICARVGFWLRSPGSDFRFGGSGV